MFSWLILLELINFWRIIKEGGEIIERILIDCFGGEVFLELMMN